MEMSVMPVWAWILFYVLVLLMLVIDLKSFGRKGQHEVGIREALTITTPSPSASKIQIVLGTL
jgi:tellurite resistance protein TerC